MPKSPDSESLNGFAKHLHAHRVTVLRYVSRRVGANYSLAEDVTQDCLLRVWEMRHNNPPPDAALRAYLLTTAENLLRDRFRKREPEAHVTGAESLADANTPERDYLPRETVERLRAETALLPPVLRETLRLWVAGTGYDAIAAQMNCPVGTVKSRLYAARARLRAALLKAETSPPETSQPGATQRLSTRKTK